MRLLSSKYNWLQKLLVSLLAVVGSGAACYPKSISGRRSSYCALSVLPFVLKLAIRQVYLDAEADDWYCLGVRSRL